MAAADRLSAAPRRAVALAVLAMLGVAAEAAGARLPPALGTLGKELARFRYCPDEVRREGSDWWGFWWSLPEVGCGDCEDFAAYSVARLEQLGVRRDDMALLAATVGDLPLPGGGRARLLHVWLEVRIDGAAWTIWNGQIRAGAERPDGMLTAAETAELVDDRFGPNWPYGVEMP